MKVYSPDDDLEEFCEEFSDGSWVVKPSQLFARMFDAGEKYLESLGHTFRIPKYGRFKVTTEIGNPWTLKLTSRDRKSEFPTDLYFDFVPAVVIADNMLPSQLMSHIERVRCYIEDDDNTETLLAIALHKTDSYRFEIDCHDLERKLMHCKGTAKMVVRMMKLLRNMRKGPLEKLTSHMIKTVVMRRIIQIEERNFTFEERKEYWQDFQTAFMDCMALLTKYVNNDKILDVLFPRFNLLRSKIKDSKYRSNMKAALKHVLTILQKGDFDLAFQPGACSLCDEYFTTSAGQSDEKKLKAHLASAHALRTWCTGGATCTCIKDKAGQDMCLLDLGKCEPGELEKEYKCRVGDCGSTFQCHDRLVQHCRDAHHLTANLKHAICPHCHTTFRSKCELYQHIYRKNPEHKGAAEKALIQKGHGNWCNN